MMMKQVFHSRQLFGYLRTEIKMSIYLPSNFFLFTYLFNYFRFHSFIYRVPKIISMLKFKKCQNNIKKYARFEEI